MAWVQRRLKPDILEEVGLMSPWLMLSFEKYINFFMPLGTIYQNSTQLSVKWNKLFGAIIRSILTIYGIHFLIIEYQHNHL